jgi:hypothetical protein
MGDFLNLEIVHHSILLAQECFREEDYPACERFLKGVQVAADAFPIICAQQESFETLMELFIDCRSSASFKKKESNQGAGIVTILSAILAKAAPCTGQLTLDDSLPKHLLNLCCRDGTPEQARHAVSTMAALIHSHGSSQTTDAFGPLLKSLASPSRLTLSTKPSTKLVSVLVALAELADCAPNAMTSARGQKALHFALDNVLMGRAHFGQDDTSDGEEEDGEEEMKEVGTPSPTKSGRRKSSATKRKSQDHRKHLSPGSNQINPLEDTDLSITCRIICAAIEFLVSHIRSSILASQGNDSDSKRSGTNLRPSDDLIEKVFDLLSQILRDHGIPPSSQDRKECRMRQDRAALRIASATNLLRL